MVNFMWEAIKDKNAKNSDVEQAIKSTLDQYNIIKYPTGISRFGKELLHVQGKMPCSLSIKESVCNRQICTTCDLNGE